MKFFTKSFNELTTNELYDLLRLRSEVFVVEQNCTYQDLDNYDQKAQHVLGYNNEQLVAAARIKAPGIYYKEAAIGRVVTAKSVRMEGVGKQLMAYSIKKTSALFDSDVKIMAQCYLTKFYEDFGFVKHGNEFLEDGIPHIEMVLKTS